MSLRIRSIRDCWRGAPSAFDDELASAPPKNRSHAARTRHVLHDSLLPANSGRTARAPIPPGPDSEILRLQCADAFPRFAPFRTETVMSSPEGDEVAGRLLLLLLARLFLFGAPSGGSYRVG